MCLLFKNLRLQDRSHMCTFRTEHISFDDRDIHLFKTFVEKTLPKIYRRLAFFKFQKQLPEVFCKKGVLRIFAKFTAKHLKQSLFLRKLQALACSSKKKALAQVLSCEFCDISKNAFPTEHLQATASEVLFQTYESILRCSQLIYLC